MKPGSPASIDLLRQLVEFDTTSGRSNLGLIEFVTGYLAELGVAWRLVESAAEGRVNLFATIGEGDVPGIILSGHTDVVPVDVQDWGGDPFRLRIENGKALGRGTCDMKGFLACVLAAVPDFVAARLSCPVHLAFSCDEEVGCAGVRHLVDDLRSRNLRVRACIVGEPTRMQPVTAHTGKQVFCCSFNGTAMHSSLAPKAVNAIAFAGDTLHHINRMADRLRRETVDDPRFAFPFPTVNVGMIEGGSAVNVVAESCEFDVEYRHPPGVPAALFAEQLQSLVGGRIRQAMRCLDQGADADCRRLISYPAFSAGSESTAVSLVERVAEAPGAGAVNFGTEAGIFEEAGFPSVVLGPGDIEQAHQPDEYIELEQLDACDAFLKRLVNRLTSEEASR